ncbi:MAG: single-stranded DNA-binding protein [Kiritimatiellia bacterium]
MASLNRVLLIGNLVRDPEVRYTPKGQAVSDLRLAVTRQYKSAEGEQKGETCYLDVVVWGRQAETCGEYLKRGSPVLVEGRLQQDEWEKEGQKFSRLRVVAERVQFLSGPRGAQFRDMAPETGEPAARSEVGSRPAAEETPPSASGTADDEDNIPF